jgi:hypothetical protein
MSSLRKSVYFLHDIKKWDVDSTWPHAQLGVKSLKVCFDNVREGIGVTYLFKICNNSISVRSFRCAQH